MTPEQLRAALEAVAAGGVSGGGGDCATMAAAVGPAVGCLMATFGTSLIRDCIFAFDEPQELAAVETGQRLELWGLQVRRGVDANVGVCTGGGARCTCMALQRHKARR
jgi:hypothetical protein